MIDFELLSIPDAARAIDSSEPTVRRLIRNGVFPGVVRVGGAVKIDARKLAQWIDAGGATYVPYRRREPSSIQLPVGPIR